MELQRATYGYNTATGQLTSMQHPQNLAGSQALDQYGYHPVTGALVTVTGRTGHAFDFTYAPNGQMVRLRGPAYSDTMVYDLEGRLVRRGNAPGATCRPVANVSAQCVNNQLNIGQSRGRWSAFNQCQTFVKQVLSTCAVIPMTVQRDATNIGPRRVQP